MRPLPPARTLGNGALQRQTLQAGRRCAAIWLETTGRRSPGVSSRPRTQPASAQRRAFLDSARAPARLPASEAVTVICLSGRDAHLRRTIVRSLGRQTNACR
jgi:hypothetical protein